MAANQLLLSQIMAGTGNPLQMLRESQKEDALIRAANSEDELRRYQIDDARYKASPEYRKSQSELARLEVDTKRYDALSKLNDSQRKEIERKASRLGQVSSWVLSLPAEMRPNAWDNSMGLLKDEGIDGTPYIGKYNDQTAAMFYKSALSVKEQLDLANKDREFGLRKREVAATERNAATSEGKAALERKQYDENQELIRSLLPGAGVTAPSGAAQGAPPTQGAPSPLASAGVTGEQLDTAAVAAAAGGNAALATTLGRVRDDRFPKPTEKARTVQEMIAMGVPKEIAEGETYGTLQRITDPVYGTTRWVDIRSGKEVARIEEGQVVSNPEYYPQAGQPTGGAPGPVVIDYTKR